MAVLGVVVAVCVGLSTEAAAQMYAFKQYGVEDGFSVAHAITFDANGALLVGTNDGVLRFDGRTFEPVPLPGLAETPILRLTTGPDGSVWMLAYPNRLFRLRPDGAAEALPPLPAPRSDFVPAGLERRLRTDPSGRLWITDNATRLWYYEGASRTWYRAPLGLEENVVDFFFQGPDTLWLATANRVGYATRAQQQWSGVEWVTDVSNILFIRPHPTHRAWIGTRWQGLYLLEKQGTTRRVGAFSDVHYTEVDTDDTGRLLFYGGGSIYGLNEKGEVERAIHAHNGLRWAPSQLLHGPEGELWMVHHEGLSVLEQAHLVHYPILDREGRTEQIKHLVRDAARDGLWISTWGGMYRLHENRVERISAPVPRATGPAVLTADGRVWWDEYKGFRFAFRNGQRISYAEHSEFVLFETMQGVRYVTTPHGLYRKDRTRAVRITPQRIGYAQVAETREGRLWLGSLFDGEVYHPGLLTIAADSLSSECTACVSASMQALLDAFQEVRLLDLRADVYGRLWMVSDQARLFCVYQQPDGTWAFRTFGTSDGLLSEQVHAIHPTPDGRLWIGTTRGLQGSTLGPGVPTLHLFAEFRARDGLEGEAIAAVLEDEEGYLWFASTRGRLHRLDWRRWPRLDSPPAHIIRLERDDQPVRPGGELRLRAGNDHLAIYLRAQTYLRVQRVRLHYRLLPLDTAWVDLATSPSIQLPYLPAGRYTFEARAVREGRPPGPVVRQAMVAVPPFYKTGWFYALCLLGGLLAACIGYRLRMRRLRAHARTLRRVVAERTRDLVAETRKTEEQARRLAELDVAKSRFFANLSHEFRTPLTLITGPLEDALAGRYDAPTLRRQHRLMLQQARRLLHLINQLLDLSKLEAGKMTLHPKPGDFVAFLHRLVCGFAPLAERRQIALQFRSEHEALPACFDPDALSTVFGNLLANALTFTPEGGKVWVTVSECGMRSATRAKRLTAGTCGMGALNDPFARSNPPSTFVEVIVKDTGPGILEDDLARIFNRFEQVDGSTTRMHEGTGIGLALTRDLVDLHGGKILVESEVGFGSTFIVRIPFSGEKGIIAGPEAPEVQAATGDGSGILEKTTLEQGELERRESSHLEPLKMFGKPNILIVEDNPDVRSFLRSHLEADYHIIEAADGEAGLKQAQAHRPDLILSDVMMPRLDGYALCRALKADEALRSIPVVLLTARAGEQDTVHGLNVGADDYLTKPFSANELRARIANLITRRQQMREQFSREVRVEPAGIAIVSEDAAFLERVLAVVEAHLGDPAFTVETLAAEVGLSSRQLTRRVRAVTGEAPGALIRRLRVERATHLLKANTGTVAEVAYAVGFRDADHFARRFRQVYGVPPSKYGTDET